MTIVAADGEIIAAQRAEDGLNKGGAEPGVGRRGKQCGSEMEPHSERPTLASAGVDKKLSAPAAGGVYGDRAVSAK